VVVVPAEDGEPIIDLVDVLERHVAEVEGGSADFDVGSRT
jgi:hypothetical protein